MPGLLSQVPVSHHHTKLWELSPTGRRFVKHSNSSSLIWDQFGLVPRFLYGVGTSYSPRCLGDRNLLSLTQDKQKLLTFDSAYSFDINLLSCIYMTCVHMFLRGIMPNTCVKVLGRLRTSVFTFHLCLLFTAVLCGTLLSPCPLPPEGRWDCNHTPLCSAFMWKSPLKPVRAAWLVSPTAPPPQPLLMF